MKEVPTSALILGGGPVGVEMSQALTRFGAKVTVVEAEERLLAREAERVGTTSPRPWRRRTSSCGLAPSPRRRRRAATATS